MKQEVAICRARRFVQRVGLTLLWASAYWAGLAAAEPAGGGVTIATGAPGRPYYAIGERLREVGGEGGLAVTVVATDGSLHNLRRIDDASDPVNLALTQSDALHGYMAEHAGFGTKVRILESIGPECVFAVAAADRGPGREEDWQRARGLKVAVPAPDSGVAVTHGIMASLIPELADDELVYRDVDDAIVALHGPEQDRVDLVFSVHRAKFRGPEVSAALERPDRYVAIPISDRRLRHKLPDGSAVYHFIDLPLVRDSAAGSRSLRTICTKGLLVAAPAKLDADAEAKLRHIIDYDWMRVYPEHR